MKDTQINKLLARQLRRKLGKNHELPNEIIELLETVSQSYDHFERDRKIIERAMEISSKELRDSYGKLAIQKEIESKNSDLEQFVSIASHDLRAPLRTINSFSKLLELELGRTELSEAAKEYLDFIITATHGMNRLILNLLEYAKVGHKNLKIVDVDLDRTLENVRRNLHGIMKENNAKLVCNSLPMIKAVPHQMLQLFQNIIGNALKFKKPDVSPIVKVNCEEDELYYSFLIEDNGIGISQNNLSKVFDAFRRLEGGKKYPGTGLGLSICKTIVDNMEGKIGVESKKGIGTTFIIMLPKSKKEIKLNEIKSDVSISE